MCGEREEGRENTSRECLAFTVFQADYQCFGIGAGAALGSAFGSLAKIVCLPLGLAVTQPQAYALVGVAAMLAANCQVSLCYTACPSRVLSSPACPYSLIATGEDHDIWPAR
jgi:hypothetical protein